MKERNKIVPTMFKTAAQLVVACWLPILCGCASQQTIHGIPNFADVEPGLYRGGQPTAAGWEYLESIGVSNVIKLNQDSEASDSMALRLGMTVRKAPISMWQQTMGEPPASQLRRVIEWMDAPGTFVHCSHGQDRTGLVVAMYRVHFDGWSRRQAELEMLDQGFHPLLRGLYRAWEEETAGASSDSNRPRRIERK